MALLKMGRFLVLLAGVAAYALGLAMAYADLGQVDWVRAGMGLLLMSLATLAAHYANEFADVDTDSLARRTYFSGGSGVLPSGILAPIWALRAAIICGGFCMGLAVWWVVDGVLSPQVLGITVLGLLGGWFYSMPPLALERRSVGELDNALLGGFLMPLIGYVAQSGTVPPLAVIRLIPVFLVVFVNLLGVHWADREADAAVGKRSWVVALGEQTRVLHAAMLLAAYALVFALTGRVFPAPVSLAVLATLPFGLYVAWRFWRSPGPFFSSLIMMVWFVCMGIGWVFS